MLAERLEAALHEADDDPELDELTKRFRGYKLHGREVDDTIARSRAAATLKRIRNPRQQERASKALKDNERLLARRVQTGKRYAALLRRIKENPSRDTGPFEDAFKDHPSPDEVDRIATGRLQPKGWWAPFKPIEIILPADGEPYLQDGNHRLRAARRAGAKRILATVTKRDAEGYTTHEVTCVIPL